METKTEFSIRVSKMCYYSDNVINIIKNQVKLGYLRILEANYKKNEEVLEFSKIKCIHMPYPYQNFCSLFYYVRRRDRNISFVKVNI